eukprot:56177-Prorocentrum_minimum.AAC.1
MSRFYEGVSAPRWPFWRARHRGGSVTRTGVLHTHTHTWVLHEYVCYPDMGVTHIRRGVTSACEPARRWRGRRSGRPGPRGWGSLRQRARPCGSTRCRNTGWPAPSPPSPPPPAAAPPGGAGGAGRGSERGSGGRNQG